MDIPRTKRPDFTPYTIEDEINSVCDRLIRLINVRRQELFELLQERRQQLKNIKDCRERAELEYPHINKFFKLFDPWYLNPRIPPSFHATFYANVYKKERETYGEFEIAVKCDKEPFKEMLKDVTDVFLKVLNPEKMNHKIEPQNHGVIAIGSLGEEFNTPQGIAFDDLTSELFIVDSGNHRIIVCSKWGEYLRHFGDAILHQPQGIAITEPFIFITQNSSILKFARFGYTLISRQDESYLKQYNVSGLWMLAVNLTPK